ncbi:sensor domain-containing phosphodiesterase [Pseudorhodoplanes sinuspersici]|uniref:Diguanylate cyclase n=1 Tax=Pseudorhodoplanes sinuspersici TaxID=1235591 RepID=A0A1W6ZUJ7_9HYPH|nr:EAL domain-containing protein [Pseudorhodoplanes sinuspersici]ARQ00993.1 diguanylate cyclase [Pseudorhodoplanes sinuspersici]RKE72630.1 diguanylate cyclase/phosphodiesterase [Pseudorhodoplanes sinuspersici]
MLLQLQNTILEMVARGDPLQATIDRLCREVELLVPDIICSVLTVDQAGLLHPLSSPSLPDHYSSALDGVEIGPSRGSCGTAAYRREPVAVVDVETDPLWADYKNLILPLGLVACWSTPICSGHGRVLGTFAFYYRERRGPSPFEQEIVTTCVHLCVIALDRHERVSERHRLAYTDALTGLGNRANFNSTALQLSSDRCSSWGLLLVDIDNLKVVNDSFGHEAGDDLIRCIGGRIGAIASTDRAFRLGGDEFAVIVQAQQGTPDIDGMADEILAVLKEPAECGGYAIVPKATIGGAVVAADDCGIETVRQNADFALYHAKETNRGKYIGYAPRFRTAMMRRVRAVRDVSAALNDHRIEAYYQPIVRLDTKDIVGVEALCRMRSENGDIIPAAEFYEATSDIHVASELTQHMLATVSQDVRRWLDMGIPFQHVGVNVSSADFYSGHLDEQITRAFQHADVSLEHLVLEVTETVYLGKRDHVVASEIKSLRSKGLQVALDDFGTGYASLTHLLTVPADHIKIDKSFVDQLVRGHASAAIIEGLVSITRKLGIKVVAEGIETPEQAALLKELGCDFGQGYLFARPVDHAVMTDLFLREVRASAPRSRHDESPLQPAANMSSSGEEKLDPPYGKAGIRPARPLVARAARSI